MARTVLLLSLLALGGIAALHEALRLGILILPAVVIAVALGHVRIGSPTGRS